VVRITMCPRLDVTAVEPCTGDITRVVLRS
jgi:hypothetical protein